MPIPGLPNIDIDKTIDTIAKVVDGNIESEQERQATLTERLRIDNTSIFKLPHLIRPISFIWAMGNETILTWATIFVVFFVKDADANSINTLLAALAANTTVLATIVGFYFNSRKAEKINAKRVFAAIEIEKEKAKVEIKKDEAILAEDKKQARIDRREQRRENRKN